jgi:hypothetical protein
MPDKLTAIFTSASEAQEAERLVGEAHASRRKGDFSEAAYRLAEAARLDPRYTPLSTAQQLVSDLQRAMRDLRDNSLTSPEELTSALKLARRLAEEDAAPESEYVTQKLTDIEGEIGRRVDAAKQYVDADLAAIEEPGNLDDKVQSLARLGTELAKIEALRADASYLPDVRTRYIAARRQLERLKLERDNLVSEVSGLDPQRGFDVAKVGTIMQRLETLAAAPLAQGDSSIATAAQNLTHRLNTYLSTRLSGDQVNPANLHECEQLLAIAQRGPSPLSPQQVNAYNAAIQRVSNASRPTEAMPVPPTAPLGSAPPGAGTSPRPGSVPPPPGGTVPLPNGGSTQQYPPGPHYGAPPPVARPGSTPPNAGPMPGYSPPYVAPPVQVNVRKGPPAWAWLIPLLIVLGIGGYFGWSIYQQNVEKEKQAQAQATATAQARSTATAVVAARETREAQETATAVEVANVTATAEVEATGTAAAEATETAIAEATANEIARLDATQTAIVAANETATAIASGKVPKGEITNLTVDLNATEGGVGGVLAHFTLTTHSLKGISCRLGAYFYFSDGTKLLDKDNEYNTVDGQVFIGSEAFTPLYEDTEFKDFTLFIPDSALDLNDPGEYQLKFNILAYRVSDAKFFATSEFYSFKFTRH